MIDSESMGGASGDIGEMTWPQVPASAEAPQQEVESIHAFAHARPEGVAGRYEFAQRGLAGTLEVRAQRGNAGMDCVMLQLRLPANHPASGRPRVLWLSADVRASWIAEATRGTCSRRDAGDRLVSAFAALAMLPGQRTVRAVEDGISAHDGLVALSGAIAAHA
jgi:hypothetical protein